MKNLRKGFALLLVLSLMMSLLSVSAGAAVKGNSYWDASEQQGSILLSEHTVLDSNKNAVAIGAVPGKVDGLLTGLAQGEMAARKFGAFEDEDDAAAGIVKLTFDVVGKPLEVPGPLDVVIIADESGSLNMYGREKAADTSYMPCLNAEHVYLADGLQIKLYQIAVQRADAALSSASNAAAAAAKAAEDARTAAEADETNGELKAAADAAATAAANAAAAAAAAQIQADELKGKLAAVTAPDQNDGSAAPDTRVFIRPASAELQYVVFKLWADYPQQVRTVIENAGVEIPAILTDTEVCNALLKNWDPDNKHYHLVNGTYQLIEEPANSSIVAEESRPYYAADKLYSYYSPAADNPYGCYDRMMVEKEAVQKLADKILAAHENNRVAYVGFTRGAYPSLSSYQLGDGGFCGKEDVAALKAVISNTNGHDYTNYAHALYMARKIIAERTETRRPCYVVFISDGKPTTSGSYSDPSYLIENGGWAVLSKENGDYPWYDDVYPVDKTTYPAGAYPQGPHLAAAEKLCGYFKEFLGEDNFYTVGFNTNQDASALLEAMASTPEHFFNCATADDFMAEMQVVQQEILTQYPDGTVTDKIGEHFDLLIDSDHPFTLDGVGYTSEGVLPDTVTLTREGGAVNEGDAPAEQNGRAAAVSWNLTDVDAEGVRVSFYVKLQDEYMAKDLENIRLHQTNADTANKAGAELSYHKLFLDKSYTLPEGYYAAEEPTVKELPTPYVQLKNSEITAVKSSNKLGQTVAVGETITYTVTLKNQGLLDMDEAIIISDAIPAGTAYVENSASDEGVYANGEVIWTVPGLAAGAEKTVSFTVTVTEEAKDKVVNIAYFGADDPETDGPDTPEIPTNEVENPLKEGEPEVYGKLSIDKKFSGASLADFKAGDRFTFVVKNTSGASVGTIVLEVKAEVGETEGTVVNTLVQVSNPLELTPGSYVIEETAYASVEGKTFSGATVANNGAVTVERADVSVVVTNNYTVETPSDPNPGTPNPGETLPDPDVPTGGEPEVDLPEEDVPLADVPKTGDASMLWLAMSALSGAGLFVLRKKKDDE